MSREKVIEVDAQDAEISKQIIIYILSHVLSARGNNKRGFSGFN
jgi:hypothetical protein